MPAGQPRSAPRPPKPQKSLKARAVALLARREYSRADLRERLVAGGEQGAADAAAVDAVLDDLAALGFLSDARFAEAVVRQKRGAHSRRAIEATLKSKGVTGEAAAHALAGSDIDDAATMQALWRRRFGTPPANAKEKARQVRFLQSRGFALSAILKLLRQPAEDGGCSEV